MADHEESRPTYYGLATTAGDFTGADHTTSTGSNLFSDQGTSSSPTPASQTVHKDSQETLSRPGRSSAEDKVKFSTTPDSETENRNGKESENEKDLEKQESTEDDKKVNEKKDDEEEEKDPNLVEWDGDDDPENPYNFPQWKKWMITVALSSCTFTVTFASSIFSTAAVPTAKLFGVSEEVMILGTSLFVLGFAFGPIAFGPLSELYGRKYPLFFGMFVFSIFNIPVAVAQNLETIFICRFLGGFFASAPLAIIGGALADIFGPIDRGIAIALFAANTFIGPVTSPFIGGFISSSYLGWRWTQWLTLIMSAAFALNAFIFVPETYAPVLLKRRAAERRFETKNWALHAKAEESKVDLKEIVEKYLLRPFKMLVLEPILVLITLYMGFIYGFLYLCFEAYPIAFQEQRGWNPGVGGLPFLSIMIGVLIAVIGLSIFTKTRFKRKLKENGAVVPEERLVPMMVGGFLLPVGMFWFGWTSNPGIIWVPEVISGAFLGAGILLIFMQGLSYIIDVYTINANSALAANTFFRSWLGAGFPMFATGMFHNLGIPWAMTLLGCLTAALFPVPILFYIYGERIRKLSRYIPQ